MKTPVNKGLTLICCLFTWYHLSAAQLLLPNVSEGCMYIPEPCTAVVLVPSPRNDSCHRQEADHFAQQVSAADGVNVSSMFAINDVQSHGKLDLFALGTAS